MNEYRTAKANYDAAYAAYGAALLQAGALLNPTRDMDMLELIENEAAADAHLAWVAEQERILRPAKDALDAAQLALDLADAAVNPD